jgi:hypothetical protein
MMVASGAGKLALKKSQEISKKDSSFKIVADSMLEGTH